MTFILHGVFVLGNLQVICFIIHGFQSPDWTLQLPQAIVEEQ